MTQAELADHIAVLHLALETLRTGRVETWRYDTTEADLALDALISAIQTED